MYEIGRLIVTCHYVRSFNDIQTSLTPKLKGCIVKGKLLLWKQCTTLTLEIWGGGGLVLVQTNLHPHTKHEQIIAAKVAILTQ